MSVTSDPPTRTIGALICSYRRPDSLLRVLFALSRQDRLPDDVMVVARHDDEATLAILAAQNVGLPLRVLTVMKPGTVHALNVGLDACRTDILSITDDDTVPHSDWLSRVFNHFAADESLGGLGGRDWCHDGERFDDRSARVVGRMGWYGRTVGNHHLGAGQAREVDFLKGANMSYRVRALAGLRFDARLRGTGAQPMEDMAFSCGVRRAGWKLLYDPLVEVDHYPAQRNEPRHYATITTNKDTRSLAECAHNEVVARWNVLTPMGRVAYVVWSFFVGTGVSPGMVQALRFTRRLGSTSWWRFCTVQRGKFAGVRTMLSAALDSPTLRVASSVQTWRRTPET